VSLDLGRAPTRASMANIRKQVKDATQIETLFLVASHTHHGPVLELDDWPDKKQPYVRTLEEKLVKIIIDADKKSQSARLGGAARRRSPQPPTPATRSAPTSRSTRRC